MTFTQTLKKTAKDNTLALVVGAASTVAIGVLVLHIRDYDRLAATSAAVTTALTDLHLERGLSLEELRTIMGERVPALLN